MNVPSGYTALDLIGFTDRDDYVSTANYVKNDLVHYNGRVWKCLIDDTTGITPVEGANWTVWIDEAAYLSGLADVTITNPANGQVIRYNSQSGKWENVGVDSTPTSGSANLVQSGGVATQLANKANSADLATVATSGDYQDLNNLPTLADVATSGQYSDLLGLPTIPTVNNGILTLQINGVTVETFNANDSNNKTANFNVPTKTSDLTNDSNFVSDANYQHITVDSAFSDTSTNPVQNKVVNSLKETFTNQSKVNGAVNMCPNNGTSQVINGVTFTVNDDKSVTVNGTATASIYAFEFVSNLTLPAGVYKITGCPDSGSVSTYRIQVYNSASGSNVMTAEDVGNGRAFRLSTTGKLLVRIGISSGTTVSNLVFKPMISVASLNLFYNDYVPYAKSNKELTEDGAKVEEISFTRNSSIVSDSSVVHITKQGKIVVFEGYVTTSSAASRRDSLFTNIGAIPVQNYTYVYLLDGNGNAYLAMFKKDGTLAVESQTGLPDASYALVGSAIVQ